MTKADVLVVGGGMVGMTAGIALAQAGLEVVLVDRALPELPLSAAYDGRSSAIAAGSRRILEGLGIWPLMMAEAEPIQEIRVSDGRAGPLGSLGWASGLFLHYDAREVGDRPLGYIVENRVTRKALAARADALPGLKVIQPESLASWSAGPGRVAAQLASGGELRASLLLAADGRQSQIRRQAGIAVQSWTYDQQGIVCSVGHERPHGGVAHEHFLPAGPFALLPMTDGPLAAEDRQPGHRSSLVWTERPKVAAGVLKLDETAFAAELTRRFGDSLGAFRVVGRRWSYPLSLLHAERYHDHRLALLGDAAHGIHPIAGQGLNLGIRDVAAIAEGVVDAARLGLDIGGADTLARYETWRRFDSLALILATDLLNRAFSNDFEPLRLARDLGLAAVEKLPPLKRVFMRHAMGAVGDLPRLARGEPL